MAKDTFRASKMLDRIKREGREHMLDKASLELIHKLDGKTGTDYNWANYVNDEPLVWIPAGDGYEGTYVNVADCD